MDSGGNGGNMQTHATILVFFDQLQSGFNGPLRFNQFAAQQACFRQHGPRGGLQIRFLFFVQLLNR
jgi:hypothetical protein